MSKATNAFDKIINEFAVAQAQACNSKAALVALLDDKQFLMDAVDMALDVAIRDQAVMLMAEDLSAEDAIKMMKE